MTEKYDRLKIHYATSRGITRACIEINDCGLIGLLSFIETRIKAPDDEAPAGSYRYLPPKTLYDSLNDVSDGRIEKQYNVPLVTCADCGEIHCWSVSAIISRDDNCVTWRLRHNHRDWDYGLDFRFEKNVYEREMNGLRCHATNSVKFSNDDVRGK